MLNKATNNVIKSSEFKNKLQEIMGGIYELFELSREHELSPISDDGVMRYVEESGKTCFQVSGQYDRPSEFLQTFLDIVRSNYEPCVFGTFFLNSNMCFLYDEIPESEFQLGYVSLTSNNNQKFSLFWEDIIKPYIEKCGYDFNNATAVYAVASTGEDRYGGEFLDEISTTLESGFYVNEVFDLLVSSINPNVNRPRKQIYSGYCFDSALDTKIRLSLWFFIRNNNYMVQ